MLPFSVSRDDRASLTEQIEVGFRRAIQAGHFKAGDSLPTLQETADALKVSLAVVRTAVRRLSREGLITARPRRGITVCPAGQHRWQAHVLYLHWASATSYYEAVSSETVMRQLLSRQIFVTSIHLSHAEVMSGYPQLNSIFHTGPINMGVLAGPEGVVDVVLAENEIPFVQLAGTATGPPSRLARRTLMQDTRPVFEQAVQHAIDCGVRSLMIAVNAGDGAEMKDVAEAAGLSVRVLAKKQVEGLGLPESVHRGGLEAMAGFLESGEPLPDLIYFADDYVAQGALTAIQARGIRIPDDVQVISWANRNLGPVFPKPLTRIEMDPVSDGQALAGLVMEALKKPDKKVKEPVMIGPTFIVGETTGRAGA